jgi:hypothetical protein
VKVSASGASRRWDALEALLVDALRLPVSPWEAPPRTHRLTTPAELARAVDIVHFNPVRHGLVADPSAWPYSTLRTRLAAA